LDLKKVKGLDGLWIRNELRSRDASHTIVIYGNTSWKKRVREIYRKSQYEFILCVHPIKEAKVNQEENFLFKMMNKTKKREMRSHEVQEEQKLHKNNHHQHHQIP
jgi:hypothetical protein